MSRCAWVLGMSRVVEYGMHNVSEQPGSGCVESSLVSRAQLGDRAAFDELARECRPLLFALAFLRTRQREEAEDLVQEVLMRAWQKLPGLSKRVSFLPWLRTVMANACISWYRGSRSRPISLSGGDAPEVAARSGHPLQDLLEQDRTRELHEALLTLPEANRLALLMHIWSDASYNDIATLTGVSASTVDGRIYRAKRQMRRLLYDNGSQLLGDEPRLRLRADAGMPPRSRREKKMSITAPDTAIVPDLPLAVVSFTRRLSLMLDAGVATLRALEILQDAQLPLDDAVSHLRARVAGGDTLSQAMSDRPDIFPKVYTGMIRAGETGHVLEEIVQHLAKMVAREWQLASSPPSGEPPVYLLLPSGLPVPESWEEMPAYQRTVTLSLFCSTFGTLLQSGVPIVQSMKTVADLLPAASREGWMRAVRCVYPAGELFSPEMRQMGIFPEFAVELILIGEQNGSLDGMLHRLAESFEDDLDFQESGQKRAGNRQAVV